ncbi:L-2-hydroxyglutarate oxidase [Chitinophagales bacterium]|nr:L-2-hydroxyglutarate oxidase [Chitinophagales bacterium]
MQKEVDILIIGGGIIGLSVAWQLSEQLKGSGKKIALLEKEGELAFHQTGHNSGVIHSGIYYKPGSSKSQKCREGRNALVGFCRKYSIPHELCGKIIVATDNTQITYLDKIFANGLANETPGISWIDSNQIKELEPHCVGVKGIRVESAGIVDYRAMAAKMAELFKGNGGQLHLNTEVQEILEVEIGTRIKTSSGDFYSKKLIACAGSQSDRLARSQGLDPGMRIVSFRGEYYDLINKEKVRNLIYPVPNPAFPFLGVHFTRMTDGRIECGPNAVFAFRRDGYKKTDFNWADTWDAVSYSGFLKLVSRNLKFGVVEQWRSISKSAFHKNLQTLIPSLEMEDIEAGRSGVRALALAPDGNLFDDFKFVSHRNSLHVLNAPSPAATASIAIGKEIVEKVMVDWSLAEN